MSVLHLRVRGPAIIDMDCFEDFNCSQRHLIDLSRQTTDARTLGEFKKAAGGIDGFEDYIPPYKNLGAIFIKAYNTSMGENE